MTDVILAPAPPSAPVQTPVRVAAGTAPLSIQKREAFVAADAHEKTWATRFVERARWPLGIYTVPVGILIVWEILAQVGVLSPTSAPAPTAIVDTGIHLWQNGTLGPDLLVSLRRVAFGLGLGLTVGIVAGIVGGLLKSGEYLFNGVMQIFNTIPILAVLPLIIIWFGIDELPKVVIIAFGACVPMYLNLFAAIRGVDQRLIEMARTSGVSTRRLISRVLLPGALPGFLVGLRFSLAYSILGLVAAETVNANSGLGFLITQAQTYLQTNEVFVGLVIYSILGLFADQFVRLLERVFLRWRPSFQAR